MQVRTIDDEQEFASLEQEWNALLATSRQDGPFLRHEWLHAWWEAYGGDARLAVVACRDVGGGLAGVLPLYAPRPVGGFRAKRLRLLGDVRAGSCGLGAIARGDVEVEVLDSLAAYLADDSVSWDVLDLRVVQQDCPFVAAAARLLGRSNVVVLPDRHGCPRVLLPSDWETYLAEGLHRSMRSNVRRSRGAATAAGATVETIDEAGSLPRAIDDALRLMEARVRQVARPDFVVTDADRTFFGLVSPALLAQGRLRFFVLRSGGRTVAVKYMLRHGDTVYSLVSGFERAWPGASPYVAVASYAAEHAIAEGCRVFDWGLGEQDYKFFWGVTQVRRFSDVRIYGPSAAARLSRVEDAAVETASRAVLAAPPRIREPLLRLARRARSSVRP